MNHRRICTIAIVGIACGSCLLGCRAFGRDTPQHVRLTAESGRDTTQSSKQTTNDPAVILGLAVLGLVAVGLAAWMGDVRLRSVVDHYAKKHGYGPEKWAEKDRWRREGNP